MLGYDVNSNEKIFLAGAKYILDDPLKRLSPMHVFIRNLTWNLTAGGVFKNIFLL